MSEALKPGAVLFTKNMDKVAAFYEALVPMRRVHEEATAIVLEVAGFELVVHRIPDEIARNIMIADPPVRRQATAHKLVFPVADLVEARERAAARGGIVDPPEREWCWRGYRACDGHDPDGNVIQLCVAEG